MIRGVLFICLSCLTACCLLSNVAKDEESIPVYLDASSFFQIYYQDETVSFPFDTGDKIEIEGTLIYHGINDWVTTNILPEAKWHASLYPYGKMLSLGDERLSVVLNDLSGQKEPFEIQWPIDNDTSFMIVSDQPLPKRWFETLDIGTSTQVCFRLAVEVQSDTGSSSLILLRPIGETAGNLILTEVRRCN